MKNVNDIDAWRRVHRKLTLAVIQSQDNVAAELAKRRYLLEEMNRCKMQNQKSSVPARKKAKKVPPPTIKKETASIVSTPVQNNWSSEQSMVVGGTAAPYFNSADDTYTNIPHQQHINQMMHPHPCGIYEGATATATEEQMSLALLMLQHQNVMQPQYQLNQSEDDNNP